MGGRFGRVVNEEFTVLLVLGMEGEAEEAFFVFLFLVIDLGLDVEEGFGFRGLLVVGDDQDLAVLGDDEEAVGAVAGVRDGDGAAGLEVGEGADGFEREGRGVDAIGGENTTRNEDEEGGQQAGTDRI